MIEVSRNELSILKKFMFEMNKSNSGNDKIEVLTQYKDNLYIKKFLLQTYSTFIQFHITSKTVEKFRLSKDFETKNSGYTNFFSLLTDLSSRTITGHQALQAVEDTILLLGQGYRDVVYKVLDKDLQLRTGITTFNKVFPKLIPVFSVALGEKETSAPPPDLNKEVWYASRKLDGLRDLTIINHAGDPIVYSREGKEFKTVQKLIDAIKTMEMSNMVFDGELCILDENGNEDFKEIQKQYKRKDFQIEEPRMLLFDILTKQEFESGTSTTTLSERLERIRQLELDFPDLVGEGKLIVPVEQIRLISQEQIKELKEKSTKLGWEGLIFRRDTIYKGKRSKDILKVKIMTEEEFIVKRIVTGPFRVIVEDKETGGTKEVTEQTMTNVIISYKGEEVSVGSGFSLAERRRFFKNPELIENKEITVSYFEESTDSEGKLSLRFPVFKCLWENGTRKDSE